MPQKKILIFSDYYLPGYKAGGAVQAVVNQVEALGDDFEFFVVTRNHDASEKTPYPGIKPEEWISQGKAKAFYLCKPSISKLWRISRDLRANVIYLSSFFSPISVRLILLKKLGLVGRIPVIVAPRGEFSPGALKVKRVRKLLYLRVAMFLNLYKNVRWHATSEDEKALIQNVFASSGKEQISVVVAHEIATDLESRQIDRFDKAPGAAKFLYISRISPKKNLADAIRFLTQLKGEVEFHIYGPIDDDSYWAHCQRLIARKPENVTIEYRGTLKRKQALEKYGEYHFFLFPTLGENFGYAILESLTAGCPVLVSDQTPWLDLQREGAGRVLPLIQRSWVEVLRECVSMSGAEHGRMRERAQQYAKKWLQSSTARSENMLLFRKAIFGDGATQVPGAQSIAKEQKCGS